MAPAVAVDVAAQRGAGGRRQAVPLARADPRRPLAGQALVGLMLATGLLVAALPRLGPAMVPGGRGGGPAESTVPVPTPPRAPADGVRPGAAAPSGPPPAGGGRGVPADQWALMVRVAQASPCGVTAADLAAIAKTESGFGADVGPNPRSGAFGYGQFMPGTFAAEGGSGDPANPADALPVMAKMLCEQGYATDRRRALNAYGGCTTPRCLGAGDYASAIDRLAARLGAPGAEGPAAVVEDASI
jgi:Transglycosylase SLT domain